MLEPQERVLLLESLKPPLGYSLDFAVGTTYSLDLITLLSVPLSFALLDRTDRYGNTVGDPLTLLGSIRKTATKFAIFCQAGAIAVPPPNRTLLGLLEANVVEAVAPNGGAFHPKCWLLRFTQESQRPHFRLICASRNLTADRSWDTAVVLEGELVDRKLGFSRNRPLGEFFAVLPTFAVAPIENELRQRISALAEEVRRVDFERPEGIDELLFHPLGLRAGQTWPFADRLDRVLVVSPFVSTDFIRQLNDATDELQLVTRLESVGDLSPELVGELASVRVFLDEREHVEEPPAPEEAAGGVPTASVTTVTAAEPGTAARTEGRGALDGLHAKLFIADAGRAAHVWTGSANATTNAFLRNVEMLVELVGSKRKWGIDAMLAKVDGEARFVDFLAPVIPTTLPAPDERQHRLEQLVEKVRRELAACKLQVVVERQDDGRWTLHVAADAAEALISLPSVSVRVWPITCHADARGQRVVVPLAPDGRLASFAGLPVEFLTTFIAFEVSASEDDVVQQVRFTLNGRGQGMPADRGEKIFLQLVASPASFEAYLRMLLVDTREAASSLDTLGGLGALPGAIGEATRPVFVSEPTLFEMLVRVLARDPARIDDIEVLMNEIARAGRSDQLLPAGFSRLWESIRAVKGELNGSQARG